MANDIFRIYNQLGGPTDAVKGYPYSVNMHTGILEVDVTLETTGVAPFQTVTQGFLDVYTCICRKDYRSEIDLSANAGYYQSAYEVFRKGFLQTAANPGSTSTLVFDDIGADPFMNRTFSETFKILSKQTYNLISGHTISLELKDSKYKILKKNTWQGMAGLRGWTKILLMIARGSAEGSSSDQINISYDTRRKYCSNVIRDDFDKSGEN